MIRVIIVKWCLRYIAETLFKYCVWIILYLVTEFSLMTGMTVERLERRQKKLVRRKQS